MTRLIGLLPAKSLAGANPIRPSFCRVCCVYRDNAGRSGSETKLMFPVTIEPLYCPPCLFFSLFGGNAAVGGFAVRHLLFTRMDEGSKPVSFRFPMNGLP